MLATIVTSQHLPRRVSLRVSFNALLPYQGYLFLAGQAISVLIDVAEVRPFTFTQDMLPRMQSSSDPRAHRRLSGSIL
jgi:hypothetical protein